MRLFPSALLLALVLSLAHAQSSRKKNVLLILVDDLRPQLGCYNVTVCGQKMHTPNIDKLASRGLTFRHAYNQYSVCSPSRNSFMSGRRPDTTLTYNFKDDFRKSAQGGEEWVTMPEAFKKQGYNTTGAGKTYHPGKPADWDYPKSWTETPGIDPGFGFNQGLGFCGKHSTCVLTSNPIQNPDRDGCKGSAQFGLPAICPDRAATDGTSHRTDEVIANYTVQLLKSHKANGVGPWFHAVGFVRPHVDWSAPQEFWDLYPADQIQLPKHRTMPPTAPKVAWVDGGYCDNKEADLCNYTAWQKDSSQACTQDEKVFNATHPVSDTVTKVWRRGYYAAVSYVDHNIGRVLDALDELGLAEDTVVGLLADHGYQLGEHAMWEKYTNWELAARVPMMLAVPWKSQSHGKVSSALLESVDMYPSLADAAGIEASALQDSLEGFSAAPLLDDPHREWKKAAFSQYARCAEDPATGFYTRCSSLKREKIQVMGYSVRTQAWRYTEWFRYTGNSTDFRTTVASELYDHRNDDGSDMDAYEQQNVVADPKNKAIVAKHQSILQEGWRKQLPVSAGIPFATRAADAGHKAALSSSDGANNVDAATFMENYYRYRSVQHWVETVPLKAPLSENIDWVTKGAVTRATSQGRCATCQDFSCVADIEGAWFLSGRPLLKLSEQEMIDCGAGDHYGMRWVVSNGGIASSQDNPLANHSDPTLKGCRGITNCAVVEKKSSAYINGSTCLTNHDESNILAMLQHGPMSVSINAGSLNGYKGGVINCTGTGIDHAVTLVAHSKDPATGERYWTIKNSWGPDFGESSPPGGGPGHRGYARLKFGNTCLRGPCQAYVDKPRWA